MTETTENNGTGRTKAGTFTKGNPGRPKGSKNKLTEAFWSDYAAAWETHGQAALEAVATSEPAKFVAVAASLMPKDVNVNTTITDMTDEQLESRIASLAKQVGDAIGFAAGNGAAPDGEKAPLRPNQIN